jgi:hypothetical protein
LRLIEALADDVRLSDRNPGAEVRMAFALAPGTAQRPGSLNGSGRRHREWTYGGGPRRPASW